MADTKQILNIDVTALLSSAKLRVASNGRQYINIVVEKRREADRFGNDLAVVVEPTHEERMNRTPLVYCGSGETLVFDGGRLVQRGAVRKI